MTTHARSNAVSGGMESVGLFPRVLYISKLGALIAAHLEKREVQTNETCHEALPAPQDRLAMDR